MKSIAIFAVVLAVAFALPPPSSHDDKDAQVVRYENDNIGVEGYNFNVETSNGISHQESAHLEDLGKDGKVIAVQGQFSYKGADGQVYTVNYVADKNGFQPQGAHLPVPPQ